MDGLTSRFAAFFRAGGWKLLVGVAVPLGLIFAVNYAWSVSRHQIAARSQYRLKAEEIAVTPQPEWIRVDVKQDVLRGSGLSELNLLDRDLAQKVEAAFAVHTWVARVLAVEKQYPSHVKVDIAYRTPAAMVEVPGGLYPIDGEGILLPPDQFDPPAVRDYLRIDVGRTLPAGPVGTYWGDAIVRQAAQLAVLLQEDWKAFQLYRVTAPRADEYRRPRRDGDRQSGRGATLELQSRRGARVIWGRGIGQEQNSEPKPMEKLSRLRAYVQKHGPLNELGESLVLDLSKSTGHSRP